jgi:hypothetical protein
MTSPPFTNAAVEAKYESYAPQLRGKLLTLRDLAFATAQKNLGTTLFESLKWGQPSFSASDGKGSTFRLDEVKNSGGKYALYFLCQTSLISTFRELYESQFEFEGNRAIIFHQGKVYNSEEIAHCMALAMNYRR